MSLARLVSLTALLLLAAGSVASNPPRIAIIIDDLGYGLAAGRRAIHLPGPVSFAVLPGTPRANALAVLAFDSGKEVLLHLPLQAKSDDAGEDPLGLNLYMNHDEFVDTFNRALQSVPHAIGVNSHRGSLLTRHPGHMLWLMEAMRAQENLFFVDSYTTPESVAIRIAKETGIDARKRDVFLDPDRAPETVAREFARMKRLADKRGSVIAIGHPYAATLELLERELPKLAAEGYELVTISELVQTR
jgi:polysaccharide deacetylase 2 family uncharacterized protein YibQ